MTTKHKEPSGESVLAARIIRAYPSLSAYSAASLATELTVIERAQRRHAERCCSGEDGGYVQRVPIVDTGCAHAGIPRGYRAVHDPDAERRAGERIDRRVWRWRSRLWDLACKSPSDAPGTTGVAGLVELQDDPRGAVLLLRLPGEQEAADTHEIGLAGGVVCIARKAGGAS